MLANNKHHENAPRTPPLLLSEASASVSPHAPAWALETRDFPQRAAAVCGQIVETVFYDFQEGIKLLFNADSIDKIRWRWAGGSKCAPRWCTWAYRH